MIKDFHDLDNYHVFEYKGVKTYIFKSIILSDNMLIYKTFTFPGSTPQFNAKGMKVKNI
ncbi:MAG: hypothetical protein ACERKV_11205 [Clostridiaceae bacterium]